MKVSGIKYEDFVNYKKPSMYIGTIKCDGKCWRELGLPSTICQNDELNDCKVTDVDDDVLCRTFIRNPITKAVVIGGLEPFDQFGEVAQFIMKLRKEYDCEDDVVIYTGYYPHEIDDMLDYLKKYSNIIIKFGRYVPNDEALEDAVLGITLASSNQYAVKIS